MKKLLLPAVVCMLLFTGCSKESHSPVSLMIRVSNQTNQSLSTITLTSYTSSVPYIATKSYGSLPKDGQSPYLSHEMIVKDIIDYSFKTSNGITSIDRRCNDGERITNGHYTLIFREDTLNHGFYTVLEKD